ncbi:hypothetical protein KH5H1_07380 [Corallococcus caeni]|nr:hypothetical protein KH5H1_07380 [Corallococcus sp. KH5-1]
MPGRILAAQEPPSLSREPGSAVPFMAFMHALAQYAPQRGAPDNLLQRHPWSDFRLAARDYLPIGLQAHSPFTHADAQSSGLIQGWPLQAAVDPVVPKQVPLRHWPLPAVPLQTAASLEPIS